jgi:transcriptional regulator of acetoin/glycerol metabolism
MNDAISTNDQQRFVELKQELVELEKRAYDDQHFDDNKSSDEDDHNFTYSIPSKSTPLLQIDYDAKVNEIIKCNTKQYDKRISVLLLGEHLAGKSVISHIFTERTIRPYQETYGYSIN